MIDRYKMIIWAKPKEETLEEQVNSAFKILIKLKEYFLINSLLLPAKSKKEVREFEVSKESIKELIIQKKDKKFPNLGSELSFFTSIEDDESFSIDFSVGKSYVNIDNTMVISLPINFTSENLIKCIELFAELVILYNSYYACITSNFNLKLYDSWFDYINKVPKVFFWVNYWGKDIINKLSISEIQEKTFKCESMNGGYYIRLQKEPFDSLNNNHLEFQKKLNRIIEI